jgi:hypothetical protein
MVDEPEIKSLSLIPPFHIRRFMMDSHNGKKKLHFLVFPWLAQGHINPFLELSKALAIHGHKVSFLSTPVNISRLKSSLQLQDWPGRIDLLELPLPPTEGLTPGAECTTDIPVGMALTLKEAMDGMEKPFRSLLGQLSPDYLVHDFVQYWTQSAAAEMRVPAIYFCVFSAAFCCQVFDPCKLRNQEITAEEVVAPLSGFPSSAITLSLYEARELVVMYRGIPGQVIPAYRVAKCLEGCVAVAVKSSFQEEDKYIRYFQDAIGVPLISVGPLTPDIQPAAAEGERSDLLEWLDRQRAASVVFVSFGTEVILSEHQIHELALGLEASGLPFLLRLRFPRYSDGGHDPLGLLPEGFQTRTHERGLIVQGWVPQVQILSHPSIGGFLSHGGLNSILESLSFGIPLIFLPIRIDQGLNARQISVELKAGIEIERGEDDSFLRENICSTLTMAMAGEEREKLRSKAEKARDIIAAKKQSCIHDFIEKLEQLAEDYKKKSG